MARKIFVSTLERTVKGKNGQSKKRTSEVTTISFYKGQKLYVRGIVGSTAENGDLATITDLPDKHSLVVFNEDVLTRVEGLSDNLMTCTHLRFVRANRPKPEQTATTTKAESAEGETKRKPRVFHSRVTLFGRLLAACLQANLEPVSVPGGLQYALAFCNDENGDGGEQIIAAPPKGMKVEPEDAGEICTGFIVPNSQVDELLAGLPPRE
ncbi:MAG: hypothetical protein HY226_06795 [Candidatus Vogelbacteria bacterium]|nr:hypothetical protein [Candidatus Vogelbacteria bacterium]